MRHIHIGNSPLGHRDVTWSDEHCAQDAGPNGRRSAALRILEVSHELDRLAFLDGDSDEFVDMLRAIAARLYVNTSAARRDHRELLATVDGARAQLSNMLDDDDEVRRLIADIVALLVLAADILRPFAS